MIQFKDVSFEYGSGEVTVEHLSFEIKQGEFIAIIGENGAGKSTTSKLMNGLLKPASGQVLVKGMDTRTTKTSRLAKHIGFLFQNPDRQICQNTVKEELKFGLDLVSAEDEAGKEARIRDILDRFSLDGDSDPFLLSRGERQRVALASLLVTEPEILILDEPTTGLDYRECTEIMNEVRRLNEEKQVTIIMVCHDMEVVSDYAGRVLVMAGGQILADGKTAEIFRRDQVLERAWVVPPQMTGLAKQLGGEFYLVDRMEEMIEVIMAAKKLPSEKRASAEGGEGVCKVS